MQIKKEDRNLFQITLTGHELATLISSVRWIADGATGDLTSEVLDNINRLLRNYDKASSNLLHDSPS